MCRVATVYQDRAAMEQVLGMFRRLGGKFTNELDFLFASWGFDELGHPRAARSALEVASVADILVFATHGNLPTDARTWLKDLADRRKGREGALALLVAEPVDLAAPMMALLMFFEGIALRSKMDFLPLFPTSPEGPILPMDHGTVDLAVRVSAAPGTARP